MEQSVKEYLSKLGKKGGNKLKESHGSEYLKIIAARGGKAGKGKKKPRKKISTGDRLQDS